MNKKQRKNLNTILALLAIIVGVTAAFYLAPIISSSTGWNYWIVFFVVAIDVIFVFGIPINIRDYYAMFRLHQDPIAREVVGVSMPNLIALFMLFIVLPIVIFLWIISLIIL
jgi:hypothetical protein